MGMVTKRWNDPREAEDGTRILVSRYRPRGVSRSEETWDEWWPDLGPSRALHAAYWGKNGQPRLPFATYRERYLTEMQAQIFRIRALAGRSAGGETITLLCSSACSDPALCHRTLLMHLIAEAAQGRRPR